MTVCAWETSQVTPNLSLVAVVVANAVLQARSSSGEMSLAKETGLAWKLTLTVSVCAVSRSRCCDNEVSCT